MYRIVIPILIVLAGGVMSAQPKYGHRDPYEVLEIAAKKSAELRSAHFSATVERKAFDGAATDTVRSQVAARRDSTNLFGIVFRSEGSTGDLSIYNGDSMWVGVAGDTADLFDNRDDAEGSARSQTLAALTSRLVFGDDDPFTGVAEGAAEIECEGLDTIGGVVCHAMTVRMPDAEGYTGRVRRYSFGADDYVLRRLISETQSQGLTEKLTFTVTNLAIDTVLPDTEFTFDPVRELRPVRRAAARTMKAEDVRAMVAVGQVAPDWTLRDPSGNDIALSALRGSVVVLDFWGTWCRPCVMAMPEIQKLHEEYRERGVVVIGINVELRADADPVAMMTRKGATYRLALGGIPVARSYGIASFPSMIVIDREGRVTHIARGFGAEVMTGVRAVLDESVATE